MTRCALLFTVAMWVATTLLVNSPLRAELVGYWNFDDNTNDLSGNANDGAIVGGASYVADTPAGLPSSTKSILFNGTDSYVDVTPNAFLPIHQEPAFTVAMWVKGLPQGDRRVFSEGSTSNNTPLYNLGTDNTGGTGAFDLYVRDDSNTATASHPHSLGTPFDGTWHHIAWTDVNGTGTLFIDGVADGAAFSYTRTALTTDTTTIGGILRGSSCCWFGGNIDDVAIWNEELTAQDITTLAGGGSPLNLQVPEPSSLTLAAGALAGVAIWWRRRARLKKTNC